MEIKFECVCGQQVEDFTRGKPIADGQLPFEVNPICESCQRRYSIEVSLQESEFR